jgi:hypothetical protein
MRRLFKGNTSAVKSEDEKLADHFMKTVYLPSVKKISQAPQWKTTITELRLVLATGIGVRASLLVGDIPEPKIQKVFVVGGGSFLSQELSGSMDVAIARRICIYRLIVAQLIASLIGMTAEMSREERLTI